MDFTWTVTVLAEISIETTTPAARPNGGVGLAFQDAVAASQVYEHAVSEDAEAYPTIDWLG